MVLSYSTNITHIPTHTIIYNEYESEINVRKGLEKPKEGKTKKNVKKKQNEMGKKTRFENKNYNIPCRKAILS